MLLGCDVIRQSLPCAVWPWALRAAQRWSGLRKAQPHSCRDMGEPSWDTEASWSPPLHSAGRCQAWGSLLCSWAVSPGEVLHCLCEAGYGSWDQAPAPRYSGICWAQAEEIIGYAEHKAFCCIYSVLFLFVCIHINIMLSYFHYNKNTISKIFFS